MGINIFLRLTKSYHSSTPVMEDGFERDQITYSAGFWRGDYAMSKYILENFKVVSEDMEEKVHLGRDDVARIIENDPYVASEFQPVLEWFDREEPGVVKWASYEISY
jgi:hypothetical protein